MPWAGSNVTAAVVRMLCGGVPKAARTFENAIEKHAE